jgi:hypothetical protein
LFSELALDIAEFKSSSEIIQSASKPAYLFVFDILFKIPSIQGKE